MKTVIDWFNIPREYHQKGEVGIEIEVEGRRLPQAPKYWRADHDGSLRGAENLEYVLTKPLSRTASRVALGYLKRAFKENKSTVDDTVRAGIHIHINVQELNIVEVYNMMCLYLVMEPLLIKYCGEGREGNLFCLRAMDAPYLLYMLSRAARRRHFRELVSDNLRYASMNVKALGQYGSLEFRALRSTSDMERINKWVELLLCIKDAAKKFTDPVDVINSFSLDGQDAFINNVFGGNAELVKGLSDDYQVLMQAGMRCSQDVAFNVNWQAFLEPEMVEIGGLKFPKNMWFDEPQHDW